MGYFHWTDEETYKEITHTGNLFERVMSWIFDIEPEDLVPGDGNAYYGDGVYFTDYGPDYARTSIAGVCFGHSSNQDKVQCYFEIEFHGNANITEEKDHVYLLSASSKAVQHVVDHGYHPNFETDDDDDDDCPSCNKCGDSDDVSDPGGDYYWCSHCEHEIDNDGDCVTDPCSTCDESDDDDGSDDSTCPWCGEEAMHITQDDDYEGQIIYLCCGVYFDENGDLFPEENPYGDCCRVCTSNLYADDCSKESCGNCCDGGCGCEHHG